MKKFITTTAATAIGLCMAVSAQIVETEPVIVQSDTRNITIIYNADQGNRGLENLPAGDKVYAHTGVITAKSTNDSDWKYAPNWGDNSPKYELTRMGNTNMYTLEIPSISEYYGVPAGETVKKLAFVFRNANSSREGKTATGGDIFVDVMQPGFAMSVSTTLDGSVATVGELFDINISTTANADISLYVGADKAELLDTQSATTQLSYSHAFDAPGDYVLVAEADNGTQTLEKTIPVTVLDQPVEAAYPGGTPVMGAVTGDGGRSVTFCVAAPNKGSVVIVGSWNGYQVSNRYQMHYHDTDDSRYFWVTVDGLTPGEDYFYYYLVDGAKRVGDPYARLILDPYNDRYISSSVFPGLPAYPADKVQNVPLAWYNSTRDDYDWQVDNFKGVPQSNLVIYELLLRDFTGTEGRNLGNGTLRAAIDKLDYLKSLGINAVELMPIMEFNGNNSWGYNTNFYMAPDKAYGTPDDYRLFVDECHKRGMAVILDIVFNQSDGLHPWYQMYDIAENPFYNGSAPHSFSVLNDWNQDNPVVQQQWYDALTYWMTAYKVDGYRFDLVKGLGDNDSYGNTYDPSTNTWGTPNDGNTGRYNATRVARMKALHDAMRKVNPDAYFINENLAGAQEENDMAKDGETNWANINNASCEFAMGWGGSNAYLNRFYAPHDSRTWGSTVSYAESHDEERMAYKQSQWGATGVKGNVPMSMRRLGSVAAQMLMSPGAHMIWQFQELGADQTTKKSDGGNNTDPKNVVWSYLDNPDRAGLRDCYAELNNVRANNPELFAESANASIALNGWENGRTITLAAGNKAVYLFVNPNVSTDLRFATNVDFGGAGYKLLSASYNVTPAVTSNSITLPAGAYALYGTSTISAVDDIATDIDSSLPVVYYNLQGVQVDAENLAPGIYIRSQGSRCTKVVVR